MKDCSGYSSLGDVTCDVAWHFFVVFAGATALLA